MGKRRHGFHDSRGTKRRKWENGLRKKEEKKKDNQRKR